MCSQLQPYKRWLVTCRDFNLNQCGWIDEWTDGCMGGVNFRYLTRCECMLVEDTFISPKPEELFNIPLKPETIPSVNMRNI
jgi:hypothetical protein